MRYDRILAEVLDTPWAITLDYLAIMGEVLARRQAGRPFTDDEITARISDGQVRAGRSAGSRMGAVAVMPIIGALLPRAEAMERTSGAVSVQQLTAAFDNLLADPSVAAIVLDIDSPGGSVGGIAEFGDRVHAARGTKPVVALANPMSASAAYWIASQAAEFMAVPSALVGSIGVYTAHQDVSAALEKEGVKVTLVASSDRKVLSNPFEPLTAEGRVYLQERVDMFSSMFDKAVARGRGVTPAVVRETFGQGSVFGSADAKKLGLIDSIGTLADAVALAAKRAGVRPAAAAASVPLDEAAARHRLALGAKGLR